MKIKMPIGAANIISRLEANGYEAFIVGGCVRDALLGRIADDFDITTSALPNETKRIFEKTVDTGIEHGTVTVIDSGVPYEVTTYRIDGEYRDNRHPESVLYTKNVTDDLARRDFTVNAMAYNDRIGIVDAFGGIEDLNKRIIRAVGNPALRFTEDALRILRCLRFSSVLGFSIEENTERLAKEKAYLLANVSAERIFTEWKKLIGGVDARRIIDEAIEVISVFLPELSEAKIADAEAFDALTAEERQLYLFAIAGRSDNFESAMRRLKTDSRTRVWGARVLSRLTLGKNPTEKELRLFSIGNDDSVTLSSARLSEALGLTRNGVYAELKAIIDSNSVRRIDMLDINGKELMSLGYSGEAVGKMLDKLLFEVAICKLENEKSALLAYARKYINS